MAGSLFLPRAVRDELVAHAEGSAPEEAAALLLGRSSPGGAAADEAVLASNAERSASRFSVPARELIGAYAAAEGRGKEVVGIFHSHPSSPASPSRADAGCMRVNPCAWVIYSVRDREMAAFECGAGGAVSPVRLEVG